MNDLEEVWLGPGPMHEPPHLRWRLAQEHKICESLEPSEAPNKDGAELALKGCLDRGDGLHIDLVSKESGA